MEKIIVLAAQWSVKNFSAPNSPFEVPVILENWWRKEEEKQLQTVLLFK